MLSQLPVDIKRSSPEEIDRAILRAGIIAELDAITFYEQMAQMASEEKIKKVLLEIAREEKTHLGEFQALLLQKDPQQKEELEKGKKETAELS